MTSGDTTGLTSTPNFLPEHYGAEGDPRYPSPRHLRGACAMVVDFVLQFVPFVTAVGAVFVLVVKSGVAPPLGVAVMLIPVTLIVGNRIVLPKLVHASIGDLLFGLVKIRGEDGEWPRWLDLVWASNGLARYNSVVTVRRCDVQRP